MKNLLLCLTLLLSITSHSEERFFFSKLSSDKGLSQITVKAIKQDSDGYMWFGTRGGLNRYDGYTFDVFLSEPEDSTTISDNDIICLQEDQNGFLWAGTHNGLSRIELKTDRVSRYSFRKIGGAASTNAIMTLCYDTQQRLWVGTAEGVFLYDRERDKFESIKVGSLDRLYVNSISELNNKLYIATRNKGLVIFDCISGRATSYEDLSAENQLTLSRDVRITMIDSHENLWIGTYNNGICVRKRGQKLFETFNTKIPGNIPYPRTIIESPHGKILIASSTGLVVIDPKTEATTTYNSYGRTGDLSHWSVYGLLFDKAGTLWVGTYAGGINYHNESNRNFLFRNTSEDHKILGLIGPVVETKNHIYLATEGCGLLEEDKSSGTITNYIIDKSSNKAFFGNIIKSLYVDGDKILCGTNLGSIYSFDIHSKRFSLFFDTNVDNPIYCMTRNSAGNLIVGGLNNPHGMLELYPDGRVIRQFRTVGGGNERFPNMRSFLEISPGRYLIGTRAQGLFDYNTTTGELHRHSASSLTNQLSSGYISSIFKDSRQRVWVGTYGGGFAQFDPLKGSFETFRNYHGTLSNNICAINEDSEARLWISTAAGLTQFFPETNVFLSYDRNNGIPIDEFTPNATCKLANGHLIFSGNNGYISFSPQNIHTNRFIPPIVLRSISINNTPLTADDKRVDNTPTKEFSKRLRLQHDQTNLAIGYSALNFVSPEQNNYVYRLEGFEENWNEVGERRIAYYTNIPAGKYRFVVKGSNNDMIWNQQGATMQIIVMPPYWKRWWAYLIYIIAAGTATRLIIHYYTEHKRLENAILLEKGLIRAQEELHSARNSLFTNFTHELRTPLSLILNPLEDIIKSESLSIKATESIELIRSNGNRLLRLVNNLMDFQKSENDKLRLKVSQTDFVLFTKNMVDVFAELARSRKIEIEFTSDQTEVDYRFDTELMEKVYFNYISNAFKNTPNAGRITIELTKMPYSALVSKIPSNKLSMLANQNIDYLLINIKDSGAGIPNSELEKIFYPFYQVAQNEHSASGTGLGLSLSKSIIELHHGIIWAESPKGSGAIFRTLLPIDNTLLANEQESQSNSHNATLHPPIPPAETVDQSAVQNAKRSNVLVVEDNADNRHYIVSKLSQKYNTFEAVNGSEAIEKAFRHIPDLIISDVMMPKMNGLEMTAQLKNDLRTSHIPIILLTAKSMTADIMEGYETGADDYVTKPFDINILQSRIDNMIASHEKLKEIYGKRFSLESMGVDVTSIDEKFMNKFYEVLEQNIANTSLNIDLFCQEIGMSRANLYRKVKSITNLSPTEFIRNFRLEMAAKILKESNMSISDIYVMVGFGSIAYFSNSFKTLYGMSPSEYITSVRNPK